MRRFLLTGLLICCCSLLAGAQTLIFSKQPIDPSRPPASVQNFSAGEPIYAQVQAPKAFLDYSRGGTVKQIWSTLKIYTLHPPLYDYQQPSENFEEAYEIGLSGEVMKQSSLVLDLAPEPQHMTAYRTPGVLYKKFGVKIDGPVATCKFLSRLGPGKHTLIVRFFCQDEEVAAGQLTVSGSDFSRYSTWAQELTGLFEQGAAAGAGLPPAGMSDPALEKIMLAALLRSQTYRTRIGGKVLRMVITDPEWFIERHPLTGAILFRYIRAAAAVEQKDGTCWVYPLITFKQDYAGGYQPVRFDGVGDRYRVERANLKR